MLVPIFLSGFQKDRATYQTAYHLRSSVCVLYCRDVSDPVILHPFLLNILNRMMIAKVIQMFKGGTKTDVTNYRLISLLPQFSKILFLTRIKFF